MKILNGKNRWAVVILIAVGLAIPTKLVQAAALPCDIYATGTTPCVAAYSTVRLLSGSYTGPLYQVHKADGTTKDILATGGFANAAVQDTFCGTGTCTISKLYDQSGKKNDLIKAPAGCYTGTASLPDNESNAKGKSLTVGGHKVYGLYMVPQDGYRNNTTTGMPTGSQSQGIYEVADGMHGGDACCWDFGNASTNNCNGGTGNMNTLYFGTGYWGKGAGSGPWFLADLENGVWSGGSGASGATNTSDPSMKINYAFGILKTSATNYAIRVANAESGALTTAYDGATPTSLHWSTHGGIVLGIGGDNSNSSFGTFYEGVITFGRPADSTDTAILKNVQAAGYGSTTITSVNHPPHEEKGSTIQVQFHMALSQAVMHYTLTTASRVTLAVFDHQGRLVANLTDAIVPAGNHNAIWESKGAPAGLYIARLTLDGRSEWSGKILVGK